MLIRVAPVTVEVLICQITTVAKKECTLSISFSLSSTFYINKIIFLWYYTVPVYVNCTFTFKVVTQHEANSLATLY
jgi:hypothetical protein